MTTAEGRTALADVVIDLQTACPRRRAKGEKLYLLPVHVDQQRQQNVSVAACSVRVLSMEAVAPNKNLSIGARTRWRLKGEHGSG